MAKSNAERQAALRGRNAGQCARLNTMVSLEAKRALEQLAKHYGVTQRKAIERAVLETLQPVLQEAHQPPAMPRAAVVECKQDDGLEKEAIRKWRPLARPRPGEVIEVIRRKHTVFWPTGKRTAEARPLVGKSSPLIDTSSPSAGEPTPSKVTANSLGVAPIDFPRQRCPQTGMWIYDFGF